MPGIRLVSFIYERGVAVRRGCLGILASMTNATHDLKAGYYWYTMANDPPAIIHIHADGGATLMGTDLRMDADDVAGMIAQGEQFFWIEPPPARQQP